MPRDQKKGNGSGTVYQRPDGTWAGQLTVGWVDGRQVRRTVSARTKTEARRKLNDLRADLATGSPSQARSGLVLAAFADQWLAAKRAKVSERSAEIYGYEIARYLLPELGRLDIGKIDPLAVERMQAAVHAKHGARAASKARLHLNQVMRYAVRMRLIRGNPVEAVDPVRATTRGIELLSRDELLRFLAAAKEHRYFALFYLAAANGLRRGELLGLAWEDVRDDSITTKRIVKIVNGKHQLGEPKTKRGARRVPIAPDTRVVLLEHQQRQDEERAAVPGWVEHGLVFPNTLGKPENPHNLLRALKAIQDAAGVRRFRIHDLRHLFASMMIRQGVDPRLLSDRLGHARASFTLDTYTHLFEEQRTHFALPLSELMADDRN